MRLKRKIAPFIFGVSIGLIIGVGFFVFKINDWFNRMKETASGRITVIQQPVKNVVLEPDRKKENPERFRINMGKRNKVNYAEVDSLLKTDDNVKIATDELLTVKNVKAIHIGDNVAEKDTVAAALAEVEEKEPELYYIEFWKTPLNSKGYRFMKNKVMLYGFMDYNVLLYEVDGVFFIKSAEQVYRLLPGADFRQLDRVIDSELLAKLN